jgi:hypothetical protein
MVFNATFNNISVISFDSKRPHALTKMNNNIMGLGKGVLYIVFILQINLFVDPFPTLKT